MTLPLSSVFRYLVLELPHSQNYLSCTNSGNASVDHVSAVATPKLGPVFWHVVAGMTVIVSKTDGTWLM